VTASYASRVRATIGPVRAPSRRAPGLLGQQVAQHGGGTGAQQKRDHLERPSVSRDAKCVACMVIVTGWVTAVTERARRPARWPAPPPGRGGRER
jgi:hypothetical protein